MILLMISIVDECLINAYLFGIVLSILLTTWLSVCYVFTAGYLFNLFMYRYLFFLSLLFVSKSHQIFQDYSEFFGEHHIACTFLNFVLDYELWMGVSFLKDYRFLLLKNVKILPTMSQISTGYRTYSGQTIMDFNFECFNFW